jgi:alpha-1,6-mannosyltransferase
VKILDLAEFFSERGGGVRAYLTQLLREGGKRGHELVVVAPGPRDEESALEGGRVVRLRGPAMPYDPSYHALTALGAARARIRAERPDVLQASAPYVAATVVATERAPLRVLVIHSDFIDTYARPVLSRVGGPRLADFALAPPWKLFARLAGRFDLTLVSGAWLAAKLRRHGVPRVVCVPFGIDHARFCPAHHDPMARAEMLGPMASTPGARLLVIAGRLAVEKRARLALEACARASREVPVAVAVMGDGPERGRLEALAQRLGLCVTFTGFLKDREQYARMLASADALVHACAVETFGFVVAEALASGVPVVVPRAGGAAEFVNDDCAETFAADGGPVAAAVATLRLLRRPAAPLRDAAVRAAAKVDDASAHFDRLFSLYARALAEGRDAVLEVP